LIVKTLRKSLPPAGVGTIFMPKIFYWKNRRFNMYKRIISLIVIITFVSTLGPLPPAFALRAKATGENPVEGEVARAIGGPGATAASTDTSFPETYDETRRGPVSLEPGFALFSYALPDGTTHVLRMDGLQYNFTVISRTASYCRVGDSAEHKKVATPKQIEDVLQFLRELIGNKPVERTNHRTGLKVFTSIYLYSERADSEREPIATIISELDGKIAVKARSGTTREFNIAQPARASGETPSEGAAIGGVTEEGLKTYMEQKTSVWIEQEGGGVFGPAKITAVGVGGFTAQEVGDVTEKQVPFNISDVLFIHTNDPAKGVVPDIAIIKVAEMLTAVKAHIVNFSPRAIKVASQTFPVKRRYRFLGPITSVTVVNLDLALLGRRIERAAMYSPDGLVIIELSLREHAITIKPANVKTSLAKEYTLSKVEARADISGAGIRWVAPFGLSEESDNAVSTQDLAPEKADEIITSVADSDESSDHDNVVVRTLGAVVEILPVKIEHMLEEARKRSVTRWFELTTGGFTDSLVVMRYDNETVTVMMGGKRTDIDRKDIKRVLRQEPVEKAAGADEAGAAGRGKIENTSNPGEFYAALRYRAYLWIRDKKPTTVIFTEFGAIQLKPQVETADGGTGKVLQDVGITKVQKSWSGRVYVEAIDPATNRPYKFRAAGLGKRTVEFIGDQKEAEGHMTTMAAQREKPARKTKGGKKAKGKATGETPSEGAATGVGRADGGPTKAGEETEAAVEGRRGWFGRIIGAAGVFGAGGIVGYFLRENLRPIGLDAETLREIQKEFQTGRNQLALDVEPSGRIVGITLPSGTRIQNNLEYFLVTVKQAAEGRRTVTIADKVPYSKLADSDIRLDLLNPPYQILVTVHLAAVVPQEADKLKRLGLMEADGLIHMVKFGADVKLDHVRTQSPTFQSPFTVTGSGNIVATAKGGGEGGAEAEAPATMTRRAAGTLILAALGLGGLVGGGLGVRLAKRDEPIGLDKEDLVKFRELCDAFRSDDFYIIFDRAALIEGLQFPQREIVENNLQFLGVRVELLDPKGRVITQLSRGSVQDILASDISFVPPSGLRPGQKIRVSVDFSTIARGDEAAVPAEVAMARIPVTEITWTLKNADIHRNGTLKNPVIITGDGKAGVTPEAAILAAGQNKGKVVPQSQPGPASERFSDAAANAVNSVLGDPEGKAAATKGMATGADAAGIRREELVAAIKDSEAALESGRLEAERADNLRTQLRVLERALEIFDRDGRVSDHDVAAVRLAMETASGIYTNLAPARRALSGTAGPASLGAATGMTQEEVVKRLKAAADPSGKGPVITIIIGNPLKGQRERVRILNAQSESITYIIEATGVHGSCGVKQVAFAGSFYEAEVFQGKVQEADRDLIADLQLEAIESRESVLKQIAKAKSGHPGGSLSCVDIVTALHLEAMKYNPADPYDPESDSFFISKGHGAPELYEILAKMGVLPKEDLDTLRTIGGLQGHPSVETPGVLAPSGSLGHGLGIALGESIAWKMQGKPNKAYVLLGDGDSQEGTVYEAATLAGNRGMDNLVAILDFNRLQIDGSIADTDTTDLETMKTRWQTFGWHVITIDGHNMDEILWALDQAKNNKTGKPVMIIAETVKGKGVSFMEGNVKWHGKAPNDEELRAAIDELEAEKAKLLEGRVEQYEAWRKAHERIATEPVERKEAQPVKAPELVIPEPSKKYEPGTKVATRVVLNDYLGDIIKTNKGKIATMEADLLDSVGMKLAEELGQTFSPENREGSHIRAGIREQLMPLIAMGIARAAMMPAFATFDVFIERMANQLSVVAYGKFPLLAIGTHTGVGVGEDGPTHFGLDGGALVATKGITVLEPADAEETIACIQLALKLIMEGKPVFIRFTRQAVPVLNRNVLKTQPDWQEAIARDGFYTIHDTRDSKAKKPDITLVATGATVSEAIQAAENLKAEGKTAVVINVVSISKTGERGSEFAKLLKESRAQNVPIITVQDAIADTLERLIAAAIKKPDAPAINGRITALGVPKLLEDDAERKLVSGNAKDLYRKYGIDAEGIKASANAAIAAAQGDETADYDLAEKASVVVAKITGWYGERSIINVRFFKTTDNKELLIELNSVDLADGSTIEDYLWQVAEKSTDGVTINLKRSRETVEIHPVIAASAGRPGAGSKEERAAAIAALGHVPSQAPDDAVGAAAQAARLKRGPQATQVEPEGEGADKKGKKSEGASAGGNPGLYNNAVTAAQERFAEDLAEVEITPEGIQAAMQAYNEAIGRARAAYMPVMSAVVVKPQIKTVHIPTSEAIQVVRSNPEIRVRVPLKGIDIIGPGLNFIEQDLTETVQGVAKGSTLDPGPLEDARVQVTTISIGNKVYMATIGPSTASANGFDEALAQADFVMSMLVGRVAEATTVDKARAAVGGKTASAVNQIFTTTENVPGLEDLKTMVQPARDALNEAVRVATEVSQITTALQRYGEALSRAIQDVRDASGQAIGAAATDEASAIGFDDQPIGVVEWQQGHIISMCSGGNKFWYNSVLDRFGFTEGRVYDQPMRDMTLSEMQEFLRAMRESLPNLSEQHRSMIEGAISALEELITAKMDVISEDLTGKAYARVWRPVLQKIASDFLARSGARPTLRKEEAAIAAITDPSRISELVGIIATEDGITSKAEDIAKIIVVDLREAVVSQAHAIKALNVLIDALGQQAQGSFRQIQTLEKVAESDFAQAKEAAQTQFMEDNENVDAAFRTFSATVPNITDDKVTNLKLAISDQRKNYEFILEHIIDSREADSEEARQKAAQIASDRVTGKDLQSLYAGIKWIEAALVETAFEMFSVEPPDGLLMDIRQTLDKAVAGIERAIGGFVSSPNEADIATVGYYARDNDFTTDYQVQQAIVASIAPLLEALGNTDKQIRVVAQNALKDFAENANLASVPEIRQGLSDARPIIDGNANIVVQLTGDENLKRSAEAALKAIDVALAAAQATGAEWRTAQEVCAAVSQSPDTGEIRMVFSDEQGVHDHILTAGDAATLLNQLPAALQTAEWTVVNTGLGRLYLVYTTDKTGLSRDAVAQRVKPVLTAMKQVDQERQDIEKAKAKVSPISDEATRFTTQITDLGDQRHQLYRMVGESFHATAEDLFTAGLEDIAAGLQTTEEQAAQDLKEVASQQIALVTADSRELAQPEVERLNAMGFERVLVATSQSELDEILAGLAAEEARISLVINLATTAFANMPAVSLYLTTASDEEVAQARIKVWLRTQA
jgi:transketolase